MKHELGEDKVKMIYKFTCDEVREIVEKEFTWDKTINKLLREDGKDVSFDKFMEKEWIWSYI